MKSVCFQDAAKHQKSKDLPAPVASKSSPNSLHYKLNVRPSAKVKPISLSSAARHKEKNRLFEGLEDSPQSNISSANSSISGASGETFVPRNPRKSVKKLNIIPKPSQVTSYRSLCSLSLFITTCISFHHLHLTIQLLFQ